VPSGNLFGMNPLITSKQLEQLLEGGADIRICDCRFDLSDPSAGRKDYFKGHIPGAAYVSLDEDMSGIKTGTNGRHPLPGPEAWAETRRRLGIDFNTHVIAYDSHGSVYASRLWWMLRATGHDKVQVLDGGLGTWTGPVSTAIGTHAPLEMRPGGVDFRGVVLVDAVVENLATRNSIVIDARTNDRFHGQNETLDPVAGHIPGALNRPFKDNLISGEFKSPDTLLEEYRALLGEANPSAVIHQCGSGVTACHNLLAMEYAGLGGSRLYAGSWSEWCSDPGRPVAR
jgi:thiosulfate/3-mercaptopyruvate sulfurtransferase